MGSKTLHTQLSRAIRCLLLTSILALSSTLAASPLVPDDIAYKPGGTVSADAKANTGVIVGSAQLPIPDTPTTAQINARPAVRQNQCTDQRRAHNHLGKSLVITRFTNSNPQTANAGNLFAAESGMAELIRTYLTQANPMLGPSLIPLGFALPDLSETQRKQQAQKIARHARAQFVLSGTIHDMALTDANATYNPGIYRRLANGFHDLTGIQKFDKRTRLFSVELELRDGFTGEPLLTRHYATSGIWNTRKPIGFDSPAFAKTPYGKQIRKLGKTISKELVQTLDCQPYIATIEAYPGQSQVILQGGANNGLQAGATMQLYQLVVVGSNTEYQVSETRLVKRPTQLHLSEVYPSHSTAVIEDGSYLNGQYLAVID